ncbi:tRNA lysidine(34) synthetase TilS [Aestuariibacter sp. GS-14]|uniref:tRNA lysidine(34) synthetase TilS n=1 Tax=Aestuariibacter sp. GS-14 TaxID=2590670 RepID=UPI00112E126D|nr:tRNA lysidine(34) synthetase TilS [Aestuariibacter sp. GS-14]TPV62032.1 tRNA lysidine(34) synthetase TilS [Aestuariibacter sp. GS-14]
MTSLLSSLKQSLTERLREHTPDALLIGLSGGVDSVVLLHALVTLRNQHLLQLPPLVAMHVNHGISANAAEWQTFCETLCTLWDVSFQSACVRVEKAPRTSLEATAREKRYQALFAMAKAYQAAVLTAHHCDDQAETVLLQLKRGAGPKGLSGMAVCSKQQDVHIWRPLLAVARVEIEQYARDNGLSWVTDESNADIRYDRNFLRNTILPAIQQRWPGFSQTLSRSATLCASQQQLLEEVCDERLASLVSTDGSLQLNGLALYSKGWQQALIRRWIEKHDAPLPSAAQVEQIINIQYASADRQPEVILGNYSVRRFRENLHLVKSSSATVSDAPITPSLLKQNEALSIGGMRLLLSASAMEHCQLLHVNHPNHITVESAALTTSVKPVGERHHKPLKQWCKLWNMPPWQRTELLLIRDDSVPLALLIPAGRQVIILSEGEAQTLSLRID